MTEELGTTPEELPARVKTLGTDWPGRALKVMPGDFSKFLPQGMGFAAPAIVRPWDDPLKALSSPNYYGFEVGSAHPIEGAPSTEPTGGTIYFDDSVEQKDLLTTLTVLGVHLRQKDFVVFEGASADTRKDRYLDQVRIMSKAALNSLYHPGPEGEALQPQPVTVGDFVWQFATDQREKWNDQYAFSGKLSGSFGGDGDWAKESLCFGFMVENSYWGVYRMWSRCWLVTK